MWTFLLDSGVQTVIFLVAAAALGLVVWDLYDGARDPAPAMRFARRRPVAPPPAPKRERVHVEPSVQIWTDGSGETRGSVRRGPSQGMRLEDMSREECEAQCAYCRQHDYPAAIALEAYIRARFRRERPRAAGASARDKALAELGLAGGATEADIHAAYLTMIKRHHPDHGGSTARAARINQAKDLLLG